MIQILLKSFSINIFGSSLFQKNVLLFIWRMWLDRLPTVDNLNKQGITIQGEAALCSFCKIENKTLEHSLFTCKFVIDVWNACYRWLGICSAIRHFLTHECSRLGTRKNKIWKLVWEAAVWVIWCHRNNIIFRKQHLDLDYFELIKFKSWLWLESFVKKFHFSFFKWYSNKLICLKCL